MINLSLHALFLFSEKGSEKMTKYFTDSPYEKEMMEIPYIILSCESCVFICCIGVD